jgi:hypothetical protein
MLYTLYRISDKGNPKRKLQHADKFYCLNNFIEVFGKENLVVFADNCNEETINSIRSFGIKLIELPALGNALSFIAVLDFALKHFNDNDTVYFVEDDYLHLKNAGVILNEGLALADYVTLYDNPDKYTDVKNGGHNHFIIENGEETKVLLTASSHWKITNSTTMSFATHIKILREDSKLWQFYKTQDYQAFQKLAGHPLRFSDDIHVLKNKLNGVPLKRINNIKQMLRIVFHYYKNKLHRPKRKLIVSIPGNSTHIETDFLSPLINWNKI